MGSPVAYSRTLLFIHSIYNSLLLQSQTPNPSLPDPHVHLLIKYLRIGHSRQFDICDSWVGLYRGELISS